ncbi:uncharacterized protein LOC124612777 [Schistocerca americana]|uniref:uncharacterized protein LOC124612777 n=1 Tax=Schistocerca americana TaxID=7009 RepID=UPI001F4F271D|nr:uncharacterized protein LOC124612777 [Schistocerca americana]
MGDGQKIEFDLSGDTAPNNAFRSSFARSFATEYRRQSKSLDYAYFEAIPVTEEDEDNSPCSGPRSLTTDLNTSQCNFNTEQNKIDLSLPVFGFHDSPFVRQAFPTRRHQHREVFKMWKEKQDALKLDKTEASKDNTTQAITREAANSSEQDTPNKMSNRKLQSPRAVAEAVDVNVLQSKVETLSWQLRQAEQSRQMYKQVMDQVAKFLKRAHISLDAIQNKMDSNMTCRVPRSRSVHTVNASPVRHSQSSDFPRTKSIAQIEGSQTTNSAFKDFTWRRTRKVNDNADEVTPAKLAEEAFRLLRIVQSLMNTNEPDLAQSLNGSLPGSQRSSLTASDELPASFHRRLNVGEVPKFPAPRNCSSFLHSASVDDRNSPDVSSIHSSSSKMTDGADFEGGCLTSGLEAGFAGSIASTKDTTTCSNISISKKHCNGCSNHITEASSASYELVNQVKPQAHQLSEDESGFSSMNSFQDVGLPMMPPSKLEGSFQEVGLPVVEETEIIHKHRRWSSSPVQSAYSAQSVTFPSETFHVLWV